jgi:hypothetical protein
MPLLEIPIYCQTLPVNASHPTDHQVFLEDFQDSLNNTAFILIVLIKILLGTINQPFTVHTLVASLPSCLPVNALFAYTYNTSKNSCNTCQYAF